MKLLSTILTLLLAASLSAQTAAAVKAAAKPAAKPKAVKTRKAAPSGAPEMAAAQTAESAPAASGPGSKKRDPFINPVRDIAGGGVSCSGGKRCLVIGEMVLRGVVKMQSGFIAVVENNAQKTYFLRENDPVFQGFVAKITTDSVVFRETMIDNLGQQSQRDVVKRLFVPAIS